MENIIITIGREYGSGGKYIGELVAERLKIPFYDKEILSKTYERTGCNYTMLEQFDEVKRNNFLTLLGSINSYGYIEDFDKFGYQELIDQTIEKLANSGSCVILGRNSNNILKDRNNVINIFIYSNDFDFKVKRKMKVENKDYTDAIKTLKNVDNQRKKYYESINKDMIWGDRNGYDYLIDSSVLGIDGTVDLIVSIYEKLKNN